MAWKEFEELKEENEQLRMLQFEAEKYAHQVRTEFPQMLLQIIGFATEAAQGKEAATAPTFPRHNPEFRINPLRNASVQ